MKTIVYFDGLCPLCSREIDHYRKMKGAENLEFKDITSTNFSAEREGLDPKLVHQVMHVRSATGELRTGVEAFVEIWSVLPSMRWLVPFARRTPFRQMLNVGYAGFARIRPYLPRKKCATDACAIEPGPRA
jgi:predicted DCC family thiol-disulfide oxidoreductase YuxK